VAPDAGTEADLRMPSQALHPEVTVEDASAADILDGLETLEGRSGRGIVVDAPGEGPDKLLTWALQEINNAMQAASAEERQHHCVDAVLHARRSLACLVDWYLERDLAHLCKDAPATPKQQARFLTSRGVIDELTSRVLERAIQKRNDVEHQYRSPTLDTAEDIVELLRRTLAALRTHSAPELGPWVFGSFLHAIGYGNRGRYAEFHGWSGPLAVFSRFGPRPWVGLVLPENKVKAVIRRAFLKETSVEELVQLQLLSVRKFGTPSSCADAQSSQLLAIEARLQNP
jgi:hypothetical protein